VTIRDESPGILGGGYNTFSSATKVTAQRFSNSQIKMHISNAKGKIDSKKQSTLTSKRAKSREDVTKAFPLKYYETP